MIGTIRLLAPLIALVSACALHAQNGWSVRHVATADGLPQNSVRDLHLDSTDHLWITTEGGLARYDGTVFRQFELPGDARPRSERMRELLATPDGELLITDAQGELYRVLEHGRAVPEPTTARVIRGRTRGGIPSIAIYKGSIACDPLLAGRGEWRKDPEWLIPQDTLHWAVLGRSHLLWYSGPTLMGRTALPPGVAWCMPAGEHVLVLDSSGQCHAARRGDLQCLPLRGIDQPWQQPMPTVRIDLFWHVGDTVGVLLVGDDTYLLHPDMANGAVRFEALHAPLPYNGKLSDVIWSERYRMLLLGTDVRGIYICQYTGFHNLQIGLNAFQTRNTYYAQMPGPRGGTIALTPDAHAMLFGADTAVSYADHIPVANHTAVVPASNGGYLYAARDLIIHYDPVTERSRPFGKAMEHVSALYLERDTLWIGSEHGVSMSTSGRARYVYGPINFFGHDGVQVIRRGPDGAIWFGCTRGLYRLVDEGRVEVVHGTEGYTVRAMERINDHWFIGTYGNGAFLLDQDGLHAFPKDPWGQDEHVHSFALDEQGFLWRSTNRGLWRCSLKQLMAYFEDHRQVVHQEHFGERAGIHNEEFNGGCDPPMLRTLEGHFSYPTMDGLVQFDPRQVTALLPNGTVLFERVVVNGREVSLDGTIGIGPNVQDLGITFSTAHWGDPANLKMEYMLEGWDLERHPLPPQQRTLTFTHLPPGDYRLVIRTAAATHDGTVGATALAFTVFAPWYAATWALLLFVFMGLGSIAVLVRAYARRYQRRNLALEEAVAERTASLSEANRALERSVETKLRLVSIITHDIVAPLRFIARAAGTARDRPVDRTEHLDTLSDIANASERLHSNARNLLSWVKQQEGRIELRPTHVAINPFIDEVFDHVREQAASKGLQLQNRTELDDVLLVDRDLLGIVLNNLVTNAITHTGLGAVTITGSAQRDHFRLVVSDTGPGFSSHALQRLERVRVGERAVQAEEGAVCDLGGLGYVIVTDLLRIMGGRFDVVTHERVGTQVIIVLPMPARTFTPR